MHIREVEIDNFKSFAHKVTIPFLDGFTTISGPNGSGKSNIIDSILFGLGLSTSRTLRAEKLFHLISTHNKRNEASVKITFEDEEASNQLVISRRIRKAPSGFVSSYTLNGKGSTLSEIHKTLDAYNISPNSYNVIMQGDVTTITNSSATERRKILDEIAGVADFDRRIEQATKELETVEQRVERSTIILTETETRLGQLEAERDQALKYQKLKDEKSQYESQISTVKYFDIKNSIERLHESILDGNKAKKNHEQELKEIIKNLEETREKLKEVQELVKAKGENEQIQIRQQVEGLKGSIARKKDAIEFIDKKVTENKTAGINAKENIEKLKEKIDDAQLRIESKNDEIKILEANIKKERSELERILNEVSDINQSANKNVEKRNQLRKQLEDKQDEENQVIKTKLPLEEKLSRLEREIAESQAKIDELKEIKKNAVSNKDTLSLQVEEIEKEMKEFEQIQKSTMLELDKVKQEIQDSGYNIQLASRKIFQLEANKRAAEEANFGRAVDTIMSSGISGIHAPLAQLGKVDKEYSTALEIAMGGRMRFIVVDDDDVASVAIEVLKSSRAGRATFLPLNKIRSAPNNMKLPREEGVIDFAINLIDFANQYTSAFYHALGDTIIVEDLGVARRLQGKYRMITLDGSLVEKSGSMTGGSAGKSGLKFSQSEDEELKIFKTRLQDLENKHEGLEGKKIGLESKLDKVRHEYSSIMNELNKKRMERDNLDRNLKDSDSVIESKENIVKESLPQVDVIKKSLLELNKKEESIKASLEKLAKEIEQVESAIPKDELSKLNELTETVEFEIRSTETKIANCRNDINGINMEIDFNKQAVIAQQERIDKLKEDNITLEQDKVQNASKIEQIEVKLKEFNEKIQEIGSKLIELQKERDEVNEKVLEQERIKNNLDSKIERIQEQIEAYKTRRKELEPELAEIRQELIDAGLSIASLVRPEISTEELMKNITRLDKRMEEMGLVNMRALVEYEEVLSKKNELQSKLETLSNERLQITERMQGYEDLKTKSFMETFNSVNENFIDIFGKLSDGVGKLILEHPHDPLSGGLTIEAQPREKKMQRLESMSGGEKSLTALAFVFAIQRHLPAPFYAFDEVDMHLDGINVEKLSEMIKTQSANTQFIVVSLRKPMIESANRTIGVTQKDSGITKVTGVKLSEC